MVELDFANIYNPYGKIDQILYAKKRINKSDTVLAIRNKELGVIVAEKPNKGRLIISESDRRIEKLNNEVSIAYSGITHDGILAVDIVKEKVLNYKRNFKVSPPKKELKQLVSEFPHALTTYLSTRVLGADFLTLWNNENDFDIIKTDCSGESVCCYAAAIGKGTRSVEAFLDEVDFNSMDNETLIVTAVKAVLSTHDDYSDIDLEILYTQKNEETKYLSETEIERVRNIAEGELQASEGPE